MLTPALIKLLDDICYVLECAALGYMGEGKSELDALSQRLSSNPDYCAVPDSAYVLDKLRSSLVSFTSDDQRQGVSLLCQASRKLWKSVGTSGFIQGENVMRSDLIQSTPPMTPDNFLEKYAVHCFFHFTDERNIPSIQRVGGLLSLQAMREKGISIIAPGGDTNSHSSDSHTGMDRYVHLCLFNQNPMEYRARQDGRIKSSRFIEIDREVIKLDGVRFTSAMANQSGIVPLTLEQATDELDFPAVYERMDWSVPEQMQRVLTARKYELLVPDIVPLHYIRNL